MEKSVEKGLFLRKTGHFRPKSAHLAGFWGGQRCADVLKCLWFQSEEPLSYSESWFFAPGTEGDARRGTVTKATKPHRALKLSSSSP